MFFVDHNDTFGRMYCTEPGNLLNIQKDHDVVQNIKLNIKQRKSITRKSDCRRIRISFIVFSINECYMDIQCPIAGSPDKRFLPIR